jgi:hypothetical protein
MGTMILSWWINVVAFLIAISSLRDFTACSCSKLYNTLMILLRNQHIKNVHTKVQKGKVILAFNYTINGRGEWPGSRHSRLTSGTHWTLPVPTGRLTSGTHWPRVGSQPVWTLSRGEKSVLPKPRIDSHQPSCYTDRPSSAPINNSDYIRISLPWSC